MTKKQYIDTLANLILQRVKFHAPKNQNSEIDYSLLDVVGIDGKYPIFLFNKPLNKIFLRAFERAKLLAKFNLILMEKPLVSLKKIEKLDRVYFIHKGEIGSSLLNTIESLNINYMSKIDLKSKIHDEFLKINGQKINFDYLPYFYMKKVMVNGVICDVKQFLLNNKNTIINFINTSKTFQKISIEVNIPLPRGYYSFKRGNNFVEVQNLTNRDKAYFNFNLSKASFSFSNISGIESCTFASINMVCEIDLKPQQTKKIFFNFGENKYCIFEPNAMDEFFKISQEKTNEIFDVKVQTRDVQFDNNFNLYLPRKIWEKWQKFDIDEENVNNWLKIKKKIVEIGENGARINPEIKGLKEVKFYRNFSWKRVFILHNDSNYLFANKIKYFNWNLLTKEIFEKNNEIYLSFAD